MIMRLLLASGLRGAARLVFALMRDRRVPFAVKLILPAAVAYVALPFDFLPDIIPVLGQVDDLVLLAVALVVFLMSVPRRVLLEHLGVRSAGGDQDGKVIEGDYRVDDDEDRASR